MADKIVEKRMTTPAILFLESVRPLNYVGSQVMVFFAPVVQAVFNLPEWDELRRVLERRESVAYFLDLLERKEGDYLLADKKRTAERAKEKAQQGTRRKWSIFGRKGD